MDRVAAGQAQPADGAGDVVGLDEAALRVGDRERRLRFVAAAPGLRDDVVDGAFDQRRVGVAGAHRVDGGPLLRDFERYYNQKLAKQLYTAFMDLDCEMLEINPLVETTDGNLIVLDTKMSFDGNALFRHKDVEALRDVTEEDPAEVEASEYDLAYIKLDGNIGCMVNGAGLAMATMDIIKLNGAFPANFLDVGGGATTEKVTAAFKIILKDPAVEGILVNIFGGIMKCDVIANGIVQAAKDVNLSVPLVVRLEGTNVQQGKDILDNSGLPIVSADNLGDAAQKIVAEVKKAA